MTRVYLDTSVFSALLDKRTPERQRATEGFWARRAEFELATSQLAREELSQAPDPSRRRRLLSLLKGFAIHEVSRQMRDLATRYVDEGVFTPPMRMDAIHVAAAVLTGQDVLLSWNFRHLVNRLRRARVNEVNRTRGLATIEILAPPEL